MMNAERTTGGWMSTMSILNPEFKYYPADSHSTVDAFKQRQEERRRKQDFVRVTVTPPITTGTITIGRVETIPIDHNSELWWPERYREYEDWYNKTFRSTE